MLALFIGETHEGESFFLLLACWTAQISLTEGKIGR
jgi:hypothetical protein